MLQFAEFINLYGATHEARRFVTIKRILSVVRIQTQPEKGQRLWPEMVCWELAEQTAPFREQVAGEVVAAAD